MVWVHDKLRRMSVTWLSATKSLWVMAWGSLYKQRERERESMIYWLQFSHRWCIWEYRENLLTLRSIKTMVWWDQSHLGFSLIFLAWEVFQKVHFTWVSIIWVMESVLVERRDLCNSFMQYVSCLCPFWDCLCSCSDVSCLCCGLVKWVRAVQKEHWLSYCAFIDERTIWNGE